MTNRVRRWLLTTLAHLVGVTFVVLGLMAGGGRFPVRQDPLASAAGIVVLGGECVGFPRTEHALDLFDAGHAPVVVFSGGTLADADIACSSAALSLEAAERLALPAEAAVIADGAQSTYDEALHVRALVRERRWRSIIVVTDVFHTRRAGRTFETLMPDVAIYVSGAPDPRFDPARWWQTEEGLVSVVNEWLKLGFYWIEYGICPF